MIDAASVEAVASPDNGGEFPEVTIDNIIAWLKNSDDIESESKAINEATDLIIKDGGSDIIFETFEKDNNMFIHKNIIKR